MTKDRPSVDSMIYEAAEHMIPVDADLIWELAGLLQGVVESFLADKGIDG